MGGVLGKSESRRTDEEAVGEAKGRNVLPWWECSWRKRAAFSSISGIQMIGPAGRFDVGEERWF